jgi:hypothetical protein
MNMLTGEEGQDMLRLPKYDRTTFDYAIIIMSYLLCRWG